MVENLRIFSISGFIEQQLSSECIVLITVNIFRVLLVFFKISQFGQHLELSPTHKEYDSNCLLS